MFSFKSIEFIQITTFSITMNKQTFSENYFIKLYEIYQKSILFTAIIFLVSFHLQMLKNKINQ